MSTTTPKRLAALLLQAQAVNAWSSDQFKLALAEIRAATENDLAQAFLQVLVDKLEVAHRVKRLERDCIAAALDQVNTGGSVH